jgi:hypothetical protein
VQHLDRALVLGTHAKLAERVPVQVLDEVLGPVSSRTCSRVDQRLVLAGAQELESLVPRVDQTVGADHLARLQGPPPGHAGHEAVALPQPREHRRRCGRHPRVLGTLHDGRQRPVDVGQHSAALRAQAEGLEGGSDLHKPN